MTTTTGDRLHSQPDKETPCKATMERLQVLRDARSYRMYIAKSKHVCLDDMHAQYNRKGSRA